MTNNNCKKVLIVMSPIIRGGMELQICEILRLLDKNLFKTIVCTVRFKENTFMRNSIIQFQQSDETDASLQQEYARWASRIYDLPPLSIIDLRGVWHIYKIIRGNKIDLIYTNQVLWAQIAGIMAGIPIILHIRSELSWPSMSRLAFWTNFISCRFAKIVLIVSEAVKEQAATGWHLNRKKIRVVHSGIDIEKFDPSRIKDQREVKNSLGIYADEKIIIQVGNFSPPKDTPSFIRMAAEINQRRADVRFILVGSGPTAKEIQTQVNAQGLHEKLLLLGRRADIPQLLSIANIFVSTSLKDASPGSMKEAMAMKLPVVATRVGGHPEIVEDNVSGFLVPPGSISSMVEKVNWLLDHPNQARDFGCRGREIVIEKFTNTNMVRGVEQAFKDVLGLE
jgi:glycosyltransferase involved in cell wall biosynthesis